jgi:site-specific DNA recombinase
MYDGRHEVLVSNELFERVQHMLDTHRAGEKKRKHMHYLKGTVFCARCDSRLCVVNVKQDSYLYYFCAARPHRKECDLPYVLSDHIERYIENHYRSLQMNEHDIEETRKHIRIALSDSQRRSEIDSKRQKERLLRLQIERNKLMQAYYANVVPLDVLGTEQERINREVQQAEALLTGAQQQFSDIEETLQVGFDLLKDCGAFYAQASDQLRRQMNQAFFDKVRVGMEGEVKGVGLMQPFKTIKAFQTQKHLVAATAVRPDVSVEPNRDFFGVNGSEEGLMVELKGFEPLTSAMRMQRSSQLSYSPTNF